jgi:UDP-N-acetylmuramyl pentapeptide phosphotransferase/UDP-N-acetylglucosamine-1-phosphate transferase
LTPAALTLAAAVLLQALVGALDDIRPMPVLPRLIAQALCVTLALWALPENVRILPSIVPVIAERAMLGFGCLWFVNLTNFMDGIDGITIAAFVPLLICAAVLNRVMPDVWLGQAATALALFLLVGLAGFLMFNWPPAQLFLGDVGSLPIGLVVSFVLVDLAGHGAIIAAIIMPLYHVMDATSTLLLRLSKGERVWDAHRQHAYQIAVDSGWSHRKVSGLVFALNCALAGLGALSLRLELWGQGLCLGFALGLTVWLVVVFRGRRVIV